MDIASKHFIKEQLIDITISNRDDQEEVTTAISKIYSESIDGIISEVCDGLVPPNEVFRIDRLEVDIGHLKFDRLAIDFPRAVKKAVSAMLFQQVRDKVVTPEGADRAERKTSESALLFYLETGMLPWYYRGGLQKLKDEFANDTDGIVLGSETLKKARSRKRAIQFFGEKALLSFLAEKLPKEGQAVIYQFRLLRRCFGKLAVAQEAVGSKVATALLKELQSKGKGYSVVMEQIIRSLFERSTSSRQKLFELLPTGLRRRLQSALQVVRWKKQSLFSEEEKVFLETLDAEVVAMRNMGKVIEEEIQEDADRVTLALEGSNPIKNAGLILVWPYLEAFFTGLGLMQDRTFLYGDSSIKAVQLLHYMVFKNEQGDETEWVLNKILCGMEVTDFVPELFDLSMAEKEECEVLLNALIQNWSALKNSGPESLRQTFLQRDGLLVPSENGWSLKVERKAFDVLLDRLTWAISVVKMPWNDYLINTEW